MSTVQEVRKRWNIQDNKYTLEENGYNVSITVNPLNNMTTLIAKNPSGEVIEAYTLKDINLEKEQKRMESKFEGLLKK